MPPIPADHASGETLSEAQRLVQAVAAASNERSRVEAELQEERLRLACIIKGTNVGTWEWNVQSGAVIVNETWAQIVGYTLGELAPISIKTWERLAHPDDLKQVNEILARHFSGELPFYDSQARMKHKAGHWVWVHDRGQVVTRTAEGKPLMMFGAHTDITERIRLEGALEKRLLALTRPVDHPEGVAFEDLFDPEAIQRIQDEFSAATGVASIIMRLDGTPITRPSNFCRLCRDIIRKTETGRNNCHGSGVNFKIHHPAGPDIQLCASGGLWDAVASITVGDHHIANWLIGQVRDESQGETKMRAYARTIGADEDAVIAAFLEVPVMSHVRFKQVAEVLFTLANQLSTIAYQNVQQARFITGQKLAEDKAARLEAQLQQTRKMELVGRLAGGVAHDFNNMLGVILGLSELALEQVPPSGRLHDDLVEIHKAGERSAELTRQLLAFGRKQTMAPKIMDMNMALEGMLTMLERLIGEHIQLIWHPKADLWQVKADSSQIDQIVTNLLVNARDSITGVGSVTLETGNSAFDDDYYAVHAGFVPGEYVMLAVSDNGCGMSQETRAHLFEPFFSTKNENAGHGLGLATVYGIVKQNNGFIYVYSELGQGSTFKIYLPRYVGEAGPVVPKGEGESVRDGRETILLVDDEPGILMLAKRMLERLGYTVLAATTPGEAIQMAREHSSGIIDLLLTDVVMPGMNGRDLANHLLPLYPGLKRLFMSGYTANVIAHHGVLDDGLHFIQKPFSKTELSAKIRMALDEV